MSLEDQVRSLQCQKEGGQGVLHPDGRALRSGVPGGDRALQHGGAREDPGDRFGTLLQGRFLEVYNDPTSDRCWATWSQEHRVVG